MICWFSFSQESEIIEQLSWNTTIKSTLVETNSETTGIMWTIMPWSDLASGWLVAWETWKNENPSKLEIDIFSWEQNTWNNNELISAKSLFIVKFEYSSNKLVLLQTPSQVSNIINKIDHSFETFVKQIQWDYYLIWQDELSGWILSKDVRIVTPHWWEPDISTWVLTEVTRSPIQNYDKFIIPSSASSYNYVSNDDMTYCSFIARLNLHKITWLDNNLGWISLDPQVISMWDAVSLVEQWKQEGIFKKFAFEQIQNLPNELSKIWWTVFDIYAFHEKMDTDNIIKKYHRFVWFFGNDGMLYVLDPVVTNQTRPIKRHEYIQQLKQYHSTIYVYNQWFYPASWIPIAEDGIFISQFGQLMQKTYQNLLTWLLDDFNQITSFQLNKNLFYLTKKSIVHFSKNTAISIGKWGAISLFKFDIDDIEYKWIYWVKIWDEKVSFSKPVEVIINLNDQIWVNYNYEIIWNSNSYSFKPDWDCLPDWSYSQSTHKIWKPVQSNLQFYVCKWWEYSIKKLNKIEE